MKETAKDMRLFDPVEVHRSYTRAEIGTAFTEDEEKKEQIKSELKRIYRPTSLQPHQEMLSMVCDDEVIKTSPILVWEMIWLHGDEDIKPPEFHPFHRDLMPTHPMDEYKEIIFNPQK